MCLLALALAACGPGGGGGGGSGRARAGSGGESAAPRIVSIHTNLATVTPSESLVIRALVTDPDGLDDVIGGNLVTPDDTAAYGAFATDARDGAYRITLSWRTLNMIAPISTDAGGSVSRTLRAEFFDVEGNQSWRDVVVALGCGDRKASTDGSCQDVTTASACEACGDASQRFLVARDRM